MPTKKKSKATSTASGKNSPASSPSPKNKKPASAPAPAPAAAKKPAAKPAVATPKKKKSLKSPSPKAASKKVVTKAAAAARSSPKRVPKVSSPSSLLSPTPEEYYRGYDEWDREERPVGQVGTVCGLCLRTHTKDLMTVCNKECKPVHKRCLTKLLQKRETDDVPSCLECGSTLNVDVTRKFVWSSEKFFGLDACSHCFDMFVTIFTVTAVSLLLYNGWNTMLEDDKAGWAKNLFFGLIGLTVIMIPLTLVKISKRWYRSNQEITILQHRKKTQ